MEQPSLQYANFFQRAAARIIDLLLFSLLYWILSNVMKLEDHQNSIISVLLLLVFWLLYYPIFESMKGTLGKIIMEIYPVNDVSLNPQSVGRAYKKAFLQLAPLLISSAIFGLGDILGYQPNYSAKFITLISILFYLADPLFMFFTVKKQTLHDILSETIVIKSVSQENISNN